MRRAAAAAVAAVILVGGFVALAQTQSLGSHIGDYRHGYQGGSLSRDLNAPDDIQIEWGTGSEAICEMDTAQKPDTMVCGPGAESNVWMYMEAGDINTDIMDDQGIQTNPTVCIHSADAATIGDDVCIAHDQGNSHLACNGPTGDGDITIRPAMGDRTVTVTQANCEVTDTITVTANGTATVGTATVTFACGSSDSALATNVAAWISTLPRLNATSSGAVVTVRPETIATTVVLAENDNAFVIVNDGASIVNLIGGGVMVGPAGAAAPDVDVAGLTVWNGTAGAVAGHADSDLIIEDDTASVTDTSVLTLLAPNASSSAFYFASVADVRDGVIRFNNTANTFEIGTGTTIWAGVRSTDLHTEDNVAHTMGTGLDSRIYFDGSDTFWNLQAVGTGGITIGAGTLPSPDNDGIHFWFGTAGAVTSDAASEVTIEDNGDAVLSLLNPAANSGRVVFGIFGDNDAGDIRYRGSLDAPASTFEFSTASVVRMSLDADSLDFAADVTIQTTAGDLTLNAVGLDVRVPDNTAYTMGTGADSRMYFDGLDTYWDVEAVGTGGLMIALADTFPAPDVDVVHIWNGTAGIVTAASGTTLTLESSNTGAQYISMLAPSSASSGLLMGSGITNNQGALTYSGSTHAIPDTWFFQMAAAARLRIDSDSMDFQQAHAITTTAGDLTLNATANLNIEDMIGINMTAPAALAAAVTTFVLTGSHHVVDCDAGGNTIATITGAPADGLVILEFVDASCTITDTADGAADTVNLSAAFTSSDDDTLTLIRNSTGTNWREVARSVN